MVKVQSSLESSPFNFVKNGTFRVWLDVKLRWGGGGISIMISFILSLNEFFLVWIYVLRVVEVNRYWKLTQMTAICTFYTVAVSVNKFCKKNRQIAL